MIAITHVPSLRLEQCELTHLSRTSINIELARAQHANYCAALTSAGCSVQNNDFNREFPDAAFVEDIAVVLDELIILGAMGVQSREPEMAGWKQRLSEFRTLVELPSGAKLEGGDVLRVGRDLLIGISTRTNAIAIEAVTKLVKRLGYLVHAVPVVGCLHLKTACTAIDEDTLLLNPNWIDCERLLHKKMVIAADSWGANVIRLPDQLLTNSQNTATINQLELLGFSVTPVDLSEFAKAEAGATCLSLLI